MADVFHAAVQESRDKSCSKAERPTAGANLEVCTAVVPKGKF